MFSNSPWKEKERKEAERAPTFPTPPGKKIVVKEKRYGYYYWLLVVHSARSQAQFAYDHPALPLIRLVHRQREKNGQNIENTKRKTKGKTSYTTCSPRTVPL